MSESLWSLDHLLSVPATYPADIPPEEGVTGIFFDGEPHCGKPTRVFAWYGAPTVRDGDLLPAIVLVHGAGGTAFAEWVRLWNARGYVAIAMDLNGAVPVGENDRWTYHDWAGPSGILRSDAGLFDHIDEAVDRQWNYHAVAAVIRAHSLLRSMPHVDEDRIGITGISWGGYTTCITVGVDHRFQFAVPVYGCGFVEEMSCWVPELEKLGPPRRAKWASLWDPKQYLPNASLPMLWVTGTNDFAYPLPSLQRSYRATSGSRTLSIRVQMQHGHGGAGESPKEIHTFADSIVNGGEPLAQITAQAFNNGVIEASYREHVSIIKAELIYTLSNDEDWIKREWATAPANIDHRSRTVTSRLPDGATVAYLNLTDARECVVSSEHMTILVSNP
jgi:dienelactone hydrolase